jgi:hypothetical protein
LYFFSALLKGVQSGFGSLRRCRWTFEFVMIAKGKPGRHPNLGLRNFFVGPCPQCNLLSYVFMVASRSSLC